MREFAPTACSSLTYARSQSRTCRVRHVNVVFHLSVQCVLVDSLLSLAPVAYNMGDISTRSSAKQARKRIDGFRRNVNPTIRSLFNHLLRDLIALGSGKEVLSAFDGRDSGRAFSVTVIRHRYFNPHCLLLITRRIGRVLSKRLHTLARGTN